MAASRLLCLVGLIVVVAPAQQVHAGLDEQASRSPSGYEYPEYSLKKPFLTGGMSIPNWDFYGNAVVSEEFVRLTPDRQSKAGSLWNDKPMYLREWEVTFQFKVSGQGTTLFGDGFAFWYTRDRGIPGIALGNQNPFVGMGVFFDTYPNHAGQHHHQHPYVSALINDGTVQYDHDVDGTHQEIAGCQAFFRNVDHPTFVRVIYRRRTVKVMVDVNGDNTWTQCFRVPGVDLPTGYYIGFSAATGELADNHDVIAVSTSETGPVDAEEQATLQRESGAPMPGMENVVADADVPHAKFHAPPRAHHDDAPYHTFRGGEEQEGGFLSSLMSLLLYVALVLGLVGAGYFGYSKMTSKNKSRYEF